MTRGEVERAVKIKHPAQTFMSTMHLLSSRQIYWTISPGVYEEPVCTIYKMWIQESKKKKSETLDAYQWSSFPQLSVCVSVHKGRNVIRGLGIRSVIECLPRMHKAMGSILSTTHTMHTLTHTHTHMKCNQYVRDKCDYLLCVHVCMCAGSSVCPKYRASHTWVSQFCGPTALQSCRSASKIFKPQVLHS